MVISEVKCIENPYWICFLYTFKAFRRKTWFADFVNGVYNGSETWPQSLGQVFIKIGVTSASGPRPPIQIHYCFAMATPLYFIIFEINEYGLKCRLKPISQI